MLARSQIVLYKLSFIFVHLSFVAYKFSKGASEEQRVISNHPPRNACMRSPHVLIIVKINRFVKKKLHCIVLPHLWGETVVLRFLTPIMSNFIDIPVIRKFAGDIIEIKAYK